MQSERLVQMANDIADFFAADPDPAVGAAGVADHLTRFWDPAMRRQIVSYLGQGGAGLTPLARQAVQRLAQQGSTTLH